MGTENNVIRKVKHTERDYDINYINETFPHLQILFYFTSLCVFYGNVKYKTFLIFAHCSGVYTANMLIEFTRLVII